MQTFRSILSILSSNLFTLWGWGAFAAWLVAIPPAAAEEQAPRAAAAKPAAKTAGDFPRPTNSQAETEPFLTPQQALASVRAPAGFDVQLFAAEPQVQQPVAMTTDPRGRLWVAENYTYADRETNYDLSLRDRIVILADEDGDGAADRRTVFWDQAQRLTSVELGFGGVWVLAPPQLLFIPDADGDDVPDGPPQVMLDGWNDDQARHNFANGLRWGPDGWLYGRSGIMATSYVGTPGMSQTERTPVACGIWRFHPVTHRFEVVCHGTTNPWGMDWDRHGELFFINTVIGHLWHAIPGAHLKRMYGEDFNPHLYELIPQTADHVHWDEGAEDWTAQRHGVSSGTDQAGGGHAHSGLLIYQGDNWPARYQDRLFTLNLHGRRINCDSLHRQGATFVGHHQADLLHVGDPWFRGIDLVAGPAGEVYLLDWSDIGECHENDGVHRTSGRIYSVRWRQTDRTEEATPPAVAGSGRAALDLTKQTDAELVERVFHADNWHARQARQLLQQRAARGQSLQNAVAPLRATLTGDGSPETILRALWTLHVTTQLKHSDLARLLDHPAEAVRSWAVRLLAERIERGSPAVEPARLVAMCQEETSGLVLTYLAAALQRMPGALRWEMAQGLLSHAEFADDPVLPRMIWYGIESVVVPYPEAAVDTLLHSRMPKVTQFTMRRLIEPRSTPMAVLERCLTDALDATPATREAIARGLHAGLRGRQRAEPPASWTPFAARVQEEGDDAVDAMVDELAVVFGDGRATDALLTLVGEASQSATIRREAIKTLVDVRAPGLRERLQPLLRDRDLAPAAIQGMAELGTPEFAATVLADYPSMQPAGKQAAIAALVQRPAWAAALLDAVETQQVARDDLPAAALRQIQLLGNASLTARVQSLWPGQQLLPAERLAAIHDWQQQLTPSRLQQADRLAGRRQFQRLCANCHQLFDEGAAIGPKLTGGQRDNLVFWLENIIAPSTSVAAHYRVQVILLDDGRVLNGVILSRTARRLVLQTTKERVTIDPARIEAIRATKVSLMPDGLLDPLTENEIAELLAYLMSPHQVPLPDEPPQAGD